MGSTGASPSLAAGPAVAVRARIFCIAALSITRTARTARATRRVSGVGPLTAPSPTISAVAVRPRGGGGCPICGSIACIAGRVNGAVSCPPDPRSRTASPASSSMRSGGPATLPSPRCGTPSLLGASLGARPPISGALVACLGRQLDRPGRTGSGIGPTTCHVTASCAVSASVLTDATHAMASSDPTSRSTLVIKVLRPGLRPWRAFSPS